MRKDHLALLTVTAVLLSGLVVLVGLVTNPGPQLLQKFAAEEVRPRLTGELPNYVPGEIIVKRKGQPATTESVPVGGEEAQSQIMSTQANIEYVEPNYLFYPQALPTAQNGLPNDPHFNEQNNLEQIQLPAAWELVRRGGTQRAARVAIIDTGVDVAHLDLGSGQVTGDDHRATGNYHGTQVAGIAAAQTNNSLGISSVPAGLSRVESINVCEKIGGQISCPADKIAAGIRRATAPIINVSLGGSIDSQTVRGAVLQAFQNGKLLIAAAGNNGTTDLVYPAAYPQVVAVAATTADGTTRATNSNYGSWVDVSAPGENILTTCENNYCEITGTSMASAQVSGLAALLWGQSETKTQTQILDASKVRTIIQNSADPVNYVYYGRINAKKTLGEVIVLPSPTPTPENFPPQAANPGAGNEPEAQAPSYNPPEGDCAQLKDAGVSVLTDPHCAFLELQNLVVVFLNIAIPFAAIAALALLLWGGLMYVIAGANPEKSEQARGTITWSVVGLILTLSAWLIMKLVVGAFGNIPELSMVSPALAQTSSNPPYELILESDKERAQANGEEKITLTARLKVLAISTPTSGPTATPEVFEPLTSEIISIANQKITFQVSGNGVGLKQLDAVTNSQGIARAEVTATQPGEKVVTAVVDKLNSTRKVEFGAVSTVRGISLEKSTLTVDPQKVAICGNNHLFSRLGSSLTQPQNSCTGDVEKSQETTVRLALRDSAGQLVTNVTPVVKVSGQQNFLTPLFAASAEAPFTTTLKSGYAESKTVTAYINGIALPDTATVDFVSYVETTPRTQNVTLDLTDPNRGTFDMRHLQPNQRWLGPDYGYNLILKVDEPATVAKIELTLNCRPHENDPLSHGWLVWDQPLADGSWGGPVSWFNFGGMADETLDEPSNGRCELITQVFRKAEDEEEPPIPQPPEKTPIEPIDPYGVVTNAKTGQVVTNATVMLYEKQVDGSFALWPGAENNNQANPQQTDTFGQYSFLVLPGEYYVSVEKANYESFRSETLEVVDEPVRHDVVLTPKTPIWFYLVIAGSGLTGLMILVAVAKRVRRKRAMESLTKEQ